MKAVLEVCVDTVDSAFEAQRAGADRLVLCSGLVLGGTTPNINFYYEVRNHLDLPISVLVKPHFGDYCCSPVEFEMMKDDIALFRDAGADAVQTGILTPDGTLDVLRMDELIVQAQEMKMVLGRAFDECREPEEAFQRAKMMGFGGLITSGQCRRSYDGRSLIARLLLNADGMEIAVAGEMEPHEFAAFRRVTAASVYQGNWLKKADSPMQYRKKRRLLEPANGQDYTVWQTDTQKIAAMRAAMDGE